MARKVAECVTVPRWQAAIAYRASLAPQGGREGAARMSTGDLSGNVQRLRGVLRDLRYTYASALPEER